MDLGIMMEYETKYTLWKLFDNPKQKTGYSKYPEYMKKTIITAIKVLRPKTEELLKHTTANTWHMWNTVKVENQVWLSCLEFWILLSDAYESLQISEGENLMNNDRVPIPLTCLYC